MERCINQLQVRNNAVDAFGRYVAQLLSFRHLAHLLLPRWCPGLAALLTVLTLLQVENADTSVIKWVNADLITQNVPRA